MPARVSLCACYADAIQALPPLSAVADLVIPASDVRVRLVDSPSSWLTKKAESRGQPRKRYFQPVYGVGSRCFGLDYYSSMSDQGLGVDLKGTVSVQRPESIVAQGADVHIVRQVCERVRTGDLTCSLPRRQLTGPGCSPPQTQRLLPTLRKHGGWPPDCAYQWTRKLACHHMFVSTSCWRKRA